MITITPLLWNRN